MKTPLEVLTEVIKQLEAKKESYQKIATDYDSSGAYKTGAQFHDRASAMAEALTVIHEIQGSR